MAHQRIDRYEVMWEREESLYDEVKNAWEEAGAMQNLGDVRNSLKGVMTSLKRWSQAKFGVVSKEIKKDQEKNGGTNFPESIRRPTGAEWP
jgi:hypothetical protein